MEAAEKTALLNMWRFQQLIGSRSGQRSDDALKRLVGQLDNEPLLLEPNQLRQRLEALDRLDAYFPDTPQPVVGVDAVGSGLYRRAREIYTRLETVNCQLYEAIRCEIQRGVRPDSLLPWGHSFADIEEAVALASGMRYAYLDELISGVLQFEE